jgi:hypothetical protein
MILSRPFKKGNSITQAASTTIPPTFSAQHPVSNMQMNWSHEVEHRRLMQSDNALLNTFIETTCIQSLMRVLHLGPFQAESYEDAW